MSSTPLCRGEPAPESYQAAPVREQEAKHGMQSVIVGDETSAFQTLVNQVRFRLQFRIGRRFDLPFPDA